MDEINKVIEIIDSIKEELNSLQELNENIKISNELYNDVLVTINDSLLNFKILDNKLLEYKSLEKSHINIIKYKLKMIQLEIDEIKKIYKSSKEGVCNFLCTGKGIKFSELNDNINNTFKDILPLLKDVNKLQHNVLGETVRIKNDLFKYGWLLSGINDINKSKIDENTFKDNLFIKYKQELKLSLGSSFNPDSIAIQGYISANIAIITDCIDTIYNTTEDPKYKKDNKISIHELNETNKKYVLTNCYDLEDIVMTIFTSNRDKYENMYNIKVKYEEYMKEDKNIKKEEEKIQEKTSQKIIESEDDDDDNESILKNYDNYKEILREIISLDYNDSSNKTLSDDLRPKAEGYGSDFPCCLIKKYKINKEETKSEKILLIINAEDQNWGGTGHINVRYTLNGDKSDIGFFINREKVQDEIYNLGIKELENVNNNYYLLEFYKKDLKDGDNILTFYLFCPKWNGSVGYVKSIKVNKKVKINGIN
jgi:hypothetical protein